MAVAERAGYRGRVLRAVDGRATAAPPPPRSPLAEAESEADRILADARAEAARIVAAAERDRDRLLDDARRDADDAARAAAAEELARAIGSLNRDLDEVRPRLAAIVLSAVREIIGLVPDAELVERLIVEGLRQLADDTRLVLEVPPEERRIVEDALDRLVARGLPDQFRVTADHHLAPGQWRLAGRGVAFEIGLDAQLEMLERLLTQPEGGDLPGLAGDRSRP